VAFFETVTWVTRSKEAIPLYYFHLEPIVQDMEGEELPDDEAARLAATETARDLAKNRPPSLRRTLVVTDNQGAIVRKIEIPTDAGRLLARFDP